MGDPGVESVQMLKEFAECRDIQTIELSRDQVYDLLHICHQMGNVNVIGPDDYAYGYNSIERGSVKFTDKFLMFKFVSGRSVHRFFGEIGNTTGDSRCYYDRTTVGEEDIKRSVPQCSIDIATIHNYIVQGGFQSFENLGIAIDGSEASYILLYSRQGRNIVETLAVATNRIGYLALGEGRIALVIRNVKRGICYIDGPYKADRGRTAFRTEILSESGIWFPQSYFSSGPDMNRDIFNILYKLFDQIQRRVQELKVLDGIF
jgi:hypothetical protein